jgi:hypothetical protein
MYSWLQIILSLSLSLSLSPLRQKRGSNILGQDCRDGVQVDIKNLSLSLSLSQSLSLNPPPPPPRLHTSAKKAIFFMLRRLACRKGSVICSKAKCRLCWVGRLRRLGMMLLACRGSPATILDFCLCNIDSKYCTFLRTSIFKNLTYFKIVFRSIYTA